MLTVTAPSELPMPAEQSGTEVVSYDDFTSEIHCFTMPPNDVAKSMIRDYISGLCSHRNDRLHISTLQTPREDIPQGTWTVAVAPSILKDDVWVLVFAVPRDSEHVWLWWPEKGGSDKQVVEFLGKMREEGNIRAEAPMCAGDVRHRAFHVMIEQAVWRAQNDGVMQRDWRSGEYAHIQ
jgi:hypothetical protein